RRPLAHRLIARSIDVNLVVDRLHPARRDVVVLALVVLVELDGLGAFHVIDDGELLVVRANHRRVGLDLTGADHRGTPCLVERLGAARMTRATPNPGGAVRSCAEFWNTHALAGRSACVRANKLRLGQPAVFATCKRGPVPYDRG